MKKSNDLKKTGNLRRSLGVAAKDATEALRALGRACGTGVITHEEFEQFKQEVCDSNKYAHGGIIPKNRDAALDNAMKENDIEEYARIKGIAKKHRETDSSMENAHKMYTIEGTVYLPVTSGYIKAECVVGEISFNHIDHFYTSRGGMRVRDNHILTDIDVNLKLFGEPEVVEKLGEQLSDFSNLELLEELEKRTTIENK